MTAWFADRIRRFPLVAYFVLVFGIAWLLAFAMPSLVPPMITVVIGSWLPNAIGLLVTGVAGGRAGLRELFSRAVRWRIDPKWYAIALFAPTGAAFLAIGLYILLGNPVPDLAPASQLLTIVLVAVFTGALGEELGWRGTALPHLQAHWNPLISSLVLGALWGLYHLPALLLAGLPQEGAALVPFMLATVGMTVLVSWTFNRTDGSLVPVFLYHFAFNFAGNATGIFGMSLVFWLLGSIWGIAAIAVIALDWTRFTRSPAASTKSL
jgi:membrane protease YdiL (CAAX protease family)